MSEGLRQIAEGQLKTIQQGEPLPPPPTELIKKSHIPKKPNKEESTFWCAFWHDWSKWTIFEEGSIKNYGNKKTVKVGRYIYQTRICERCGKAEIEKQKTVL